jgi:type IV secretory pathway VirB2 component (pilin)
MKPKILQKAFVSLTAGFPPLLPTTTVLAARRSNLARGWTAMALAWVVALGIVVAMSTPGRADGDARGQQVTGMVGIVSGKTARISAVNIGLLDAIVARLGWTANPHTIVEQTFRLEPGFSATLDLNFDRYRHILHIDELGRAEVRAMVTPTMETRANRDLLVTVQIFDDLSHETQVVLPAVQFKE